MNLYEKYRHELYSDSRNCGQPKWLKNLKIIDSTTISLFSNLVFKGVGRNPKTGKKKGGIKVGLMVKCTPERGQKCSLFHLMVKCTPIIVELPSVYRGCKPLICFQ